MGRVARLAWILLGLLAVFGAIHAPLHGDDGPCAQAALCSGAVPLLAAAAAAFVLVASVTELTRRPRAVVARPPSAWLVERGRAPPRV